MSMKFYKGIKTLSFMLFFIILLYSFNYCKKKEGVELIKVEYGVSPFQDTLLPIVGKVKGWYKEEGLSVEFRILGWTEVQEALVAGSIDVAINNISSIIATHERFPDLVYAYGFNTFDNGFALMVRPDGPFKTLKQIEEELKDHELAVMETAKQLRGKTVVTTSYTDMEQGVAAAARKGEIDFVNDVNIINLEPSEGLAAFLAGHGDAYIGGIPQRTRAGKEGMLELLTGADLGPPPINGIVTTKPYILKNKDVILKLLKVWFRIVNYMNENMEDGSSIVIKTLNEHSAANFTIDDFRIFWNNYEHYPANLNEVEKSILDKDGTNYWKARWDDCNFYFHEIVKKISKPVESEEAFYMEKIHQEYIKKYGKN